MHRKYSCLQCERQSIFKDRGHTVESKVCKWKFVWMKFAGKPYKCAKCEKHSILVIEAIHLNQIKVHEDAWNENEK